MDPIEHAERMIAEHLKAGVAGGWLRTRSEALRAVRRITAMVIADDLIDGTEQYGPRLAAYRYLREQEEKADAEDRAMLARIDGTAK